MTQMELQALPCYCATLRQAARAATALYEAVLGESGVPLTQFTALQVMMRSPSLTTTELAEVIGIDQTTATRTLAHIKKAGLARTTSTGDRRERRWVLSAEGERTVRKLMTKWEKAQAAFEARLGSAEAAVLKQSAYLAARKLASRWRLLFFRHKHVYTCIIEWYPSNGNSQEKIMNTVQSINTRKWLLVPVFAAFAAYAQASQAADSVGDTQSQVRAVLEGTRFHLGSSRPATIGAPSEVADIQEHARQILLGTIDSNAGVRVADSETTATATAGSSANNAHGGGDTQRQTQRVVLGRTASWEREPGIPRRESRVRGVAALADRPFGGLGTGPVPKPNPK
jgi:DNA-binding MarR family transcriptional regulator